MRKLNLYSRSIHSGCLLNADPPVIRREPTASLVVKGRSTELSCEADGNPPITYEWFKVGYQSSDLALQAVNINSERLCTNIV